MTRATTIAIVAALLCCATRAAAEPRSEARKVEVRPRIGYVLLGSSKASTGGLLAGLSGAYSHGLLSGDRWSAGVKAGVTADTIGLGSASWYSLGIVAGPDVGLWYRHGALGVEIVSGVHYGQIYLCRAWDVGRHCARWWNPWPRVAARASYHDERWTVGVEAGAIFVNAKTWRGVGPSLSVTGAVR